MMTDFTRRDFLLLTSTAGAGLLGVKVSRAFGDEGDRFREYVQAVSAGEGYLPWQERGVSERERLFREQIETRKTRLLERSNAIQHPSLYIEEDFRQIKKNIESSATGEKWYRVLKERADYLLNQPPGYVEQMIQELTPTNGYGWTCPNCVGKKSQEGHGRYEWDFRVPEIICCSSCGQTYPSEKYPETARLACPRMGQTFTFYLNDAERLHPQDRSGRHAYKRGSNWPIHISFSGQIRLRKSIFMINGAKELALIYRLNGDWRYAQLAKDILIRLAKCYNNWLYHDYWDSFADCDPLFAAWHDHNLPLEWKRHLCTDAYQQDCLQKAGMLATYWGAGRLWPSTDAVGHLATMATAYDLTRGGRDATGKLLWDSPARERVERGLILEYLMGAEPFLGGPNKADNWSNKSPQVYYVMAVVGRTLEIPDFSITALNGYKNVLNRAFLPDGFSRQSAAYADMYLRNLSRIPKILDNSGMLGASEIMNLKESKERLKTIYSAIFDQLRPNGSYFPLADTQTGLKPSHSLLEILAVQYPSIAESAILRAEYKVSSELERAWILVLPPRLEGRTQLNNPKPVFRPG